VQASKLVEQLDKEKNIENNPLLKIDEDMRADIKVVS